MSAEFDPAVSSPALEAEIDAWLVTCYADPLRYVLGAWDWGNGELAGESGPKPWQRQFLTDLGKHITTRQFNGSDPVEPIKMAVSSGVGPGKTALLAWLLHFLEDTRPDAKCRVTANTVTQLDTATWAEVRKWGLLKLTAERWHTTMEGMYHVGDRTNWFAVRTTCAPENAQAFAGWHNKRSTTANFYDEGGTIPDEIFEKGRGIEMDGEPFQFIFGQCSRRSGQLYRAVFGSEVDQWDSRVISGYDVSTSPVTQALYKEWEDTYGGPDSDYCRVHIRGLPPNADELQYIEHQGGERHRSSEPADHRQLRKISCFAATSTCHHQAQRASKLANHRWHWQGLCARIRCLSRTLPGFRIRGCSRFADQLNRYQQPQGG